jgi:hypothetical protein
MVSMVLLVFGALLAPEAGRMGESSREDLWVAEYENTRVMAEPCTQTTSIEARDLVFERVEPGDLDVDEVRRIAAGTREVVSFKWHAATGELTYDTSAPTGVFSDLAPSSLASAPIHPICESR